MSKEKTTKEIEMKAAAESVAAENENTADAQAVPEAADVNAAAADAAEAQTEATAQKVEKMGGKEKKPGRREAKELEKKNAEIAELNDKHLRLMAEFDNFRKRSEKEKSEMYQVGAIDTIDKILPVLDNFERAFALVEEDDKADPFTEGIEKIYKQFLQVLTDMGVTPIEALGKEFDPNLHNAVMHVEDEDTGENIIVEELQKGYMYKDSVIRYAMVKVAN